MVRKPVVTVFGSCRVVTPGSILKAAGRISLNQRNIFGFVHNAREITQQFRIVSGNLQPSARLLPFLNIPPRWSPPDAAPLEAFHKDFEETDLFVVEISSIRILQFKAIFLQIHRTREILAPGKEQEAWWRKMVRNGENNLDLILPHLTDPVHIEIASALTSAEQTVADVRREAMRIKRFLGKPVLFVTTFNCDYKRQPIPQRTVIQEALSTIDGMPNAAVFDPTDAVLQRGLPEAIKDLGHYTEAFEHEVADLMMDGVTALLDRHPLAA
jgi:hypothetical protein